MPCSLPNSDLLNLNRANPPSLNSVDYGYKMGGGRGVFSATGGSTIAAHGTGLVIPAGCNLTRVLYRVLTTFTSATDAGTIALSVVSANDVVSAAAISTGTTWDATALPVATIVTHTVSTNFAVTTAAELMATVAVEALTAGKMVIFAEWVYWGDVALT